MAYSFRYVVSQLVMPLIEALNKLGGSGHKEEVYNTVIDMMTASGVLIDGISPSEHGSIKRRIRKARFYLSKEGYITTSNRGIWILTEKGRHAKFSDSEADDYVFQFQSAFRKTEVDQEAQSIGEEDNEPDNELDNESSIRKNLLRVLRELSPTAFEHVCARLLRELGFEQVTVTQRSHDGGIDGEGLLSINPLISLKVVIQCKRYKGAVSREQVSDFENRAFKTADKGIFITTGYFSSDAKKEAMNSGKQFIELIDGEKLVDLFIEAQLGVKAKEIIVYEIDHDFFQKYINE